MPRRSVRVGVDESLHPDLLYGFPPEAIIVRIPQNSTAKVKVDLWIIPFARKDTQQVFARLRGVKVVQSMMAGVDWILPWLPPGVLLCDGRGIHDISTSEWVLAAILASLKRLPIYRDLQHRGQWRPRAITRDTVLDTPGPSAALYRILGDDLAGKTVLIVGYGSIGAAIEDRLRPFGASILRIARRPRQTPEVHGVSSLHRLLPEADVVITIVPMTVETHRLIGAAEMSLMRPGALLVNAARGPVVDTDALVAALESGRLLAALDVTDPEPLPPDHPLWRAPNCLITPHVAGSTPRFMERAFRFGARQVERYVAGEPMENIVQEAGY